MRFRPKKRGNVGPSVKNDNKKEVITFTLQRGDAVVTHGSVHDIEGTSQNGLELSPVPQDYLEVRRTSHVKLLSEFQLLASLALFTPLPRPEDQCHVVGSYVQGTHLLSILPIIRKIFKYKKRLKKG